MEKYRKHHFISKTKTNLLEKNISKNQNTDGVPARRKTAGTSISVARKSFQKKKEVCQTGFSIFALLLIYSFYDVVIYTCNLNGYWIYIGFINLYCVVSCPEGSGDLSMVGKRKGGGEKKAKRISLDKKP